MNIFSLLFRFTEMELVNKVVRNKIGCEYPKIIICPDCLGTGYDFSDGGQCDRCSGLGELEEY